MLETEIEVFRADTRASRGITAERLASVAEFDCEANPIPICVGHPKSDSPAHGSIAGFRLDGSSLFAKLKNVSDDIVEGIKKGSLLNRSMAFFDENHEANPTPGKLAPRHLGFLGGSAPGIPGMPPLAKALAFAADDEAGDTLLVEGEPAPAVIFSAAPTETHTVFEAKEQEMTDTTTASGLTAQQLDAREAQLKEREAQATARVRSQFEASNSTAIDALVREGKVLPAEAADLKLAFNALDPEGEELTFGAGDKTSKATAVGKLLSFIAGLGKRVPLGGRESPSTEFDASGDTPKTTGDFNKLVADRMKEKGLTFEAAAEEIADEIGA